MERKGAKGSLLSLLTLLCQVLQFKCSDKQRKSGSKLTSLRFLPLFKQGLITLCDGYEIAISIG